MAEIRDEQQVLVCQQEYYIVKEKCAGQPDIVEGKATLFKDCEFSFCIEELSNADTLVKNDSTVEYRASVQVKKIPRQIQVGERDYLVERNAVRFEIDSLHLYLVDEEQRMSIEARSRPEEAGRPQFDGVFSIPWTADKVVLAFRIDLRDTENNQLIARDRMIHPLLLVNSRLMDYLTVEELEK